MNTSNIKIGLHGGNRKRQSGLALIYLSISLTTLCAVCSLAVDFGRWEMCKSQLQRAADSASRAGAFMLATSSTSAINTSTSIVNENYVDAQTVGSNSKVTVSIQLLDWISASNYTVLAAGNYASANAVRVTMTYNVPLVFGSVIGVSSKPATRSSTSLLIVQSQTLFVNSTGDLWLAGEPTGTTASQPDPGYEGPKVNPLHPWAIDIAGPVGGSLASGQPYSSPAQVSLSITPGAIISVTSVSGAGNYAPGYYDAGNSDGVVDGSTAPIFDDTKAGGYAEHGIADVYMPGNSLNAVFIGSSVPDSGTPPAALDFSSQAARDYTTLSPQDKQPFFVGNGQTSGGNQQTIVVPKGATRMFLGMMDCWEWDNNSGGYTATITQKSVQTVQ